MTASSLDVTYDIVVIGAGIAGASVAAELASQIGTRATILLLEAESQAGYHATGRSAAMYVPAYGPAGVRALTRASGAFFDAPPAGFADTPLLSPRDIVMIARADQQDATARFLSEMADSPLLEMLDAEALQKAQPLLRPDYASHGVRDSSGSEIDVNTLHRGYLKRFKEAGGRFETNTQIQQIERRDGLWHLYAKSHLIQTKLVVNAAGAWADEIAKSAGLAPIGLVPKRRTALLIAPPEGYDLAQLPMTLDMEEAFYLKPEAGQLLISPANEDPMPPCDAQPDELDIAICIDRIERAFALTITRPAAKWAGLRSFVADKEPVAGFAPDGDGFFWLAGQGGYGIQTSPALSRYAAALVLGDTLPADLTAAGLTPASFAPDR